MDRGAGSGVGGGGRAKKTLYMGAQGMARMASVEPGAAVVAKPRLPGKIAGYSLVMMRLGRVGHGARSALNGFRDLSAREQLRLREEISKIRGLMPLLMKPRNHQKWTVEERAQIAQHLKRISALSPYLVVLIMPGGFLALPVLVWWLDRRRGRGRVAVS